MIDFKRCPDGMPCSGNCAPFGCQRDARPAAPESELGCPHCTYTQAERAAHGCPLIDPSAHCPLYDATPLKPESDDPKKVAARLLELYRVLQTYGDYAELLIGAELLSQSATALSLAQTEIKGHMRVEDELKAQLSAWQEHGKTYGFICGRFECDEEGKYHIFQNEGSEFDKAQARIAELEKAFAAHMTRIAELEPDAARYRWLRSQDWDTGQLFVVKQPTEIRLGTDCPSRDRLDAAIDAALEDRA